MLDPSSVPIESLLAHEGRLRRLVGALLRDDARTDDVLQETWLVALTRPPRRVAALGSWLSTVAHNLALKAMRGDGTRTRREQAVAAPEATPSTAALLQRESVRREVVDVLLALDEPYRSALVLRFLEELPPRAIARKLDVPAATVRTHLHRGLERLRTAFDARYGGDRAAWTSALAVVAGAGMSTQASAATAPSTSSATKGTPMSGTQVALLAGTAALLGTVVLWQATRPGEVGGVASPIGRQAAASPDTPSPLGGDTPSDLAPLRDGDPRAVERGAASGPASNAQAGESTGTITMPADSKGPQLAPQRIRFEIDGAGDVWLASTTVPSGQLTGPLSRGQVQDALLAALAIATEIPGFTIGNGLSKKSGTHHRHHLRVGPTSKTGAPAVHLDAEYLGAGSSGLANAIARLTPEVPEGETRELIVCPVGSAPVSDVVAAVAQARTVSITDFSIRSVPTRCSHLRSMPERSLTPNGRGSHVSRDVTVELIARGDTSWECVAELMLECARIGVHQLFASHVGGPLVDIALPKDKGLMNVSQADARRWAEAERLEDEAAHAALSPDELRALKQRDEDETGD